MARRWGETKTLTPRFLMARLRSCTTSVPSTPLALNFLVHVSRTACEKNPNKLLLLLLDCVVFCCLFDSLRECVSVCSLRPVWSERRGRRRWSPLEAFCPWSSASPWSHPNSRQRGWRAKRTGKRNTREIFIYVADREHRIHRSEPTRHFGGVNPRCAIWPLVLVDSATHPSPDLHGLFYPMFKSVVDVRRDDFALIPVYNYFHCNDCDFRYPCSNVLFLFLFESFCCLLLTFL